MYFPVHAHSEMSVMDGMDTIAAMASRVAHLGQPALALTDHGVMGGSVQLYQESKKNGLVPFPGCEFYVVFDVNGTPEEKSRRFHLGMVALDFIGYQAMIRLNSLAWRKERFYRKPIIDLDDLVAFGADFGDHVAVTTGCYFGLVVQQVKPGDWKPAERMVQMLQASFPNLYVELQDHGVTGNPIGSDEDIATALADIAWQRGLPMLIGGDSHYVSDTDQAAHDLMKQICYFGDGEDFKFPGGPYHLLDSAEAYKPFKRYLKPEYVRGIGDGFTTLLNSNRMTMPALDKYRFYVPTMVKKNAIAVLTRECQASDRWKKVKGSQYYRNRLDFEIDVIDQMDMPNYFLLVKSRIIDWCHQNGVLTNTRGSANGSLVCYLLGITNVDPLAWNTSFDRFLSLDRDKPPDIDIDVDFRGRRRLITYLQGVFPDMVQVGTLNKIGMKTDENGEESGSVMVQYMSAKSRVVDGFDGKVAPEDRAGLNALVKIPVNKSMGTNAAGFILPGDGLAVEDYLPLMRIISSDTTITQMTKDDVESLGYMKMDILGLRALQTLNGTLTRLGRSANDFDWIPWDDKKACALLRSGNCVGLFQYEGWSSQTGGKEMQIKSTLDTILGLALYRPALMNGGQKDLYLANRAKPVSLQTRLHPFFDKVLDVTCGVPLFQDQILEMLRALDMQFRDYNDLMKAIKASNGFIAGAANTFNRILPIFYDLCEDAGLDWREADEAWAAVIGFTEYGFNRAHATSYGIMSYRSAYLKAHYPLEYMASLLDVWAGVKVKEQMYLKEARRLNLTIVRPDVNFSGVSYDIDRSRSNALRKGLVSVDGIGEAVAESIVQNRPDSGYADMGDFIRLTPRRPVTGGADYFKTGEFKGVCKTLHEAGAFRSLVTE